MLYDFLDVVLQIFYSGLVVQQGHNNLALLLDLTQNLELVLRFKAVRIEVNWLETLADHQFELLGRRQFILRNDLCDVFLLLEGKTYDLPQQVRVYQEVFNAHFHPLRLLSIEAQREAYYVASDDLVLVDFDGGALRPPFFEALLIGLGHRVQKTSELLFLLIPKN